MSKRTQQKKATPKKTRNAQDKQPNASAHRENLSEIKPLGSAPTDLQQSNNPQLSRWPLSGQIYFLLLIITITFLTCILVSR